MFTWLALVLALAAGQTVPRTDRPAYVREGDRVEQEFRTYRDRLERFHSTLLAIIQRDIPLLQSELREPPPQPVVYGYQLLPRIVDNAFGQARPVTSFAYSWPITRGYINGEGIKLDRAEAEMQLAEKSTGVAKSTLILSLIGSYKSLLDNQRVIDQYIEYNRLWQRTIAENRPRYDELTKVYNLVQSADTDTAAAIRRVLGQPLVPSSINVLNDIENHPLSFRSRSIPILKTTNSLPSQSRSLNRCGRHGMPKRPTLSKSSFENYPQPTFMKARPFRNTERILKSVFM